MKLAPSDIYYSQDSISNTFGESTKHADKLIGEVLDDILKGKCSIDDIDIINIVIRDDDYRYISADNRRLWIFKKLEELGECTEIPVKVVDFISPKKCNFGATIKVRGDPGGRLWKTWEKRTPLSTRPASLLDHVTSLLPSKMSYSKKGIECDFSKLQRDITKILKDQISFTDIEMKVYRYGGKYCALDNKMLWKLQVAEKFQKRSEIKIKVVGLTLPRHIYYSGELYIKRENSWDLFLAPFRPDILRLPTLKTERVNVFDILPTTSGISDSYRGQSIVKALVELRQNPEDLPVVKSGRKFFTLDNRKLWICQKISKIEKQRSEIAVNIKIEMDSNMLRYFTVNWKPNVVIIEGIKRSNRFSCLEETFLSFLQI